MTRTPGNKKWLQNIAKKINLPLYPKKKFNGEEVTLMPDGTVRLSETGEKPSAEALAAYQDFVKKFYGYPTIHSYFPKCLTTSNFKGIWFTNS